MEINTATRATSLYAAFSDCSAPPLAQITFSLLPPLVLKKEQAIQSVALLHLAHRQDTHYEIMVYCLHLLKIISEDIIYIFFVWSVSGY